MLQQLKWISHSIKGNLITLLNPNRWGIRYRLLVSGVLLGALALVAPMYMRNHLANLANTYTWTASNWGMLRRIHEFSQLLTDSESKLRAYATSGNREWLSTVPKNNLSMDAILSELWAQSKDKPNRAYLLKEAAGTYQQWLKEVAQKVMNDGGGNPSATDVQILVSEPLAFRMHNLMNELSKDIHDNNALAKHAVMDASAHALKVVTYGGIFFLFCFVALILSLWMTLIPDLSVLLAGVKELKRGNLDHRVHLPGLSETAQLGRAFNEMAVSLQAQNEKLKELNRLKSDFVSTVSHELRTPLTAIKGSIGLILGNVTGPIQPETAEMLKITQKNTDRLIRLINEVLDVAKIEAGAIQMKFDKFSLVDIVGHAVMGIEAFAQTQGIKLVWEKPQASPLVVIDRDRIEQVVTNLLSNAIKFTEPGGTVTVKCEWENDRVIVHVSDTGQGIPEEFLARIFEKFQQAEGHRNKAKEGTGLGLTIAKAIMVEHGGNIWVNSKVGAGSTFSISLPWNGTEFADSKKTPVQAGGTKKNSILIIDDEIDFTLVLKKLLQHEGYDVSCVNSGKAGIEFARKYKPDLIILDIIMPDINGFEVRKILGESAETSDIPIVFITVSPDMKNEAANDTAGSAVQIIAKPIVPDDFKLWLKTFFNSRNSSANPKQKAAA